MKIRTFIKAYAITVLSVISLANAATWTGNGDNYNWNDSNNWDTQSVPSNSTEVTIDGDAVVGYPSGNIERNADTTLSDKAVLTVPSGRFLQGQSACIFTINNNATLNSAGDYFIVGRNAICEFNQNGGLVNLNLNRGFFMTDSTGSDGTSYNLDDGELRVNFVWTQDTWNADFPGHNGHTGHFNINGGIANFTNNSTRENYDRDVWVRYDSTINVAGGEINFEDFATFIIGRDGTGEAQVIINGGKMTISPTNSVVVGGTNASGRLIVNGGILNISSGNGLYISDSSNAIGGYVDQNSGDVIINGPVVLGNSATAVNSYYEMNGGSLAATEIILSENADQSVKFYLNHGMITLSGDQTDLANQSWFEANEGTAFIYSETTDTTLIANVPYAHNPTPTNGQVDVGTNLSGNSVDVSLGWDTGWDNTITGQPNTNITKHTLYMSNNTNDPNLYYVTEVTAGDPVATSSSYEVTNLDLDGRYYWRIDEELSNGETIEGPKWLFYTPKSTPIFITQPESVLAHPGESAEFLIEVTSVSSVSYTWYKSTDDEATPATDQIVGNDSNSLTLSNITDNDEGYYYCEVTNGGGSVFSNVVSLGVARKVIHWTLNESDYVNDMYVDITGNGHDVDPNGAPTFSNGVVNGDKNDTDPVTGGAVTITEGTGWGNAGSYDPAEFTDAFSVSAWVNQTGVDEIANGMIVSKRTAWDAGQSAWIFMINNTGQLRFQAHSSTTLNAPEGLITKNTWHHVVAAYADGYAILYIDGAQVAQGSFQPSIGSNSTFWIGRNESLNERFDGMLDDIQVYNYDLDQENIIDIYHKESGKYLCIYDQPGDINSDCEVDLEDIATVAAHWLENGFYPLDYTKK